MASVPVTCEVCKEKMDASEILDHLWLMHDINVEPERWEDGEVVIIDTTLEPEDFT
jgi:hypothetical protein